MVLVHVVDGVFTMRSPWPIDSSIAAASSTVFRFPVGIMSPATLS